MLTSKEYDKLRFEQLPWIEKHKPMTIQQLYLEETLKSRFKNFVRDPELMSNLIFTGTHGIGKTSAIKCICRELYGSYYETAVLELNMSDNKSSKIIQNDIISFCKLKLIYKDEDETKHPKFKLIILDEADNIDHRIQPQLASIMECYKKTVKFTFTCNSSANLIEAIQSRCLTLLFISSDKLIIDKLREISEYEKIKFEKNALEEISKISYDDIRSAINMLQLLFNMNSEIKVEHVSSLYDLPQQMIIKKLFDATIKKDLTLSLKILDEIRNKGYSGSDIVLGMIKTLRSDICNDIPEKTKIDIFEIASLSSYNISKSYDSPLQIYSCVCEIVDKLSKS